MHYSTTGAAIFLKNKSHREDKLKKTIGSTSKVSIKNSCGVAVYKTGKRPNYTLELSQKSDFNLQLQNQTT